MMPELGPDGYQASVARIRSELEVAAAHVTQYGVQVGVQPHCGRYIWSTLGVLQLLNGLPEDFKLVWDAAHAGLAGDDPAVTLDLAQGRLGLVNLKNATYIPTDPTDEVGGAWKPWFVPGADGLTNWSAVFRQLERQGWSGPICLTAEYSDPSIDVTERLRRDIATARRAAGEPG
jgi:sugar phosphate isomerase/epimerase